MVLAAVSLGYSVAIRAIWSIYVNFQPPNNNVSKSSPANIIFFKEVFQNQHLNLNYFESNEIYLQICFLIRIEAPTQNEKIPGQYMKVFTKINGVTSTKAEKCLLWQ